MVEFLWSILYIFLSDVFQPSQKNNAPHQEWEAEGQFMY